MTMTETRVVNVKYEKADIYIGRAKDGPFNRLGNPFVIGKDGDRETVIAKHLSYVRKQPWILEELERMKGKTLGCFCFPLPCHGDNYVNLIEEMDNGKL